MSVKIEYLPSSASTAALIRPRVSEPPLAHTTR